MNGFSNFTLLLRTTHSHRYPGSPVTPGDDFRAMRRLIFPLDVPTHTTPANCDPRPIRPVMIVRLTSVAGSSQKR